MNNKEILKEYKNGNSQVILYKDGTKIKCTKEDTFKPEFPESIDLKITNQCDLECGFCYENSKPNGKHFNKDKILNVLKELPDGVEIAVGGGNPLSVPDLKQFLMALKMMGFIPNITINIKHINRKLVQELISEKLVYAIGVSVNSLNDFSCYKDQLFDLHKNGSVQIVMHVILNIFETGLINILRDTIPNIKVLVLGEKPNSYLYKKDNAWEVKENLNKISMSFDNLAIEQLNLLDRMSKIEREIYFMGADGAFSMFVDGVDETYSVSSLEKENRISINDISLKQYFKSLKETKC